MIINRYRIGGDEFIAVLNDISRDEMEQKFDYLDTELDSFNNNAAANTPSVRFSKGLAIFDPETDHEYMDVFRRADYEMYKDKESFYSNKVNDRRGKEI